MEPFDTQCDQFQEFQNDLLYQSSPGASDTEHSEESDFSSPPTLSRSPKIIQEPPFPPPQFNYSFLTFRTIESARAIVDNLHDPSGCFICMPVHFITSIRTQKRKHPITGYIIHHDF